MTSALTHRLEGLEPDNLLAFLALLGLMQSLDYERPDWSARIYWDETVRPLRPVLVLREAADRDAVAATASDGVTALVRGHRFERNDLNYPRAEALKLLQFALASTDAVVLECLMSDGAVRDDGTIWPTPFCFLFGQGHQHFLSRLNDVPRGRLPARLAKGKKTLDLNAPQLIAATLFAPWERADLTDGFRWDPVEDRRYALRANDPSGDPAGMQHGANRLASIGLTCLPGVAVRRRSETRFLNAGTRYGADSTIEFSWPIWREPARLATVQALIKHPDIGGADELTPQLHAIGVRQIYRARRISVGKFFNVTRAERVA